MLLKLPLLLLLFTLLAAPGRAQKTAPPDKPILRIETGMHTATINRISVDAANRYLATTSDDKTVRVWNAVTGSLLQTLRPPIGTGNEGKLYAVALSPDGSTVACGGLTTLNGQKENLYLFDRATGRLTRRLTGLTDIIEHLVFSPDGRFLAASLGSGGIRLYRTEDSAPVGQDSNYGGVSYGVAFSPDSRRLAASCYDGYVRLYDVQSDGSLHLTTKSKASGTTRPFGVAFSPDGAKLAVGDAKGLYVTVISAVDLSFLYTPDTSGLSVGGLSAVCWSSDGQYLYAGGTYGNPDTPIRRWEGGGRGRATDLAAAAQTLMDLQPRRAGGVFFCAVDPAFGVLDGSGKRALFQTGGLADFRDNRDGFRVSMDGSRVQFGYQKFGQSPASFSLTARALTPGPGGTSLSTPVTDAAGLDIQGWWQGTTSPTLNGTPLKLAPYEISRSLALAPDHHSFLLGTDWSLRCFGRDGTQQWHAATPGAAWDVNVSGDEKVGVAAYGDGTIRWYRMTDGQELLAFFPHADKKRWVAWTPSGYYDCSPGGEDLIGWHVNRDRDQAADFFPASRFLDTYYRPDVVAKILTTQDEADALRLANAETGRKAHTADIQKTEPPVVVITSPEDGAKAEGETVTVEYTLRTPSGEPVTEVRALVDGRPVKTESGLQVVSVSGVSRTLSVPVPPRDCQVSVLAYNKFGASVAATVRVQRAQTVKATEAVVNVAGPEFTIQPKLYVLAVGISKYQDTSLTLTYPSKDARDFVAAMRAQKGRLYRDVAVYGDNELTDRAATKEEIESGLDWLQKQTTSNDVAMIFLSGHGGNDSNGKYFFLPVNFDPDQIKRTGLPWTDIVSTVQDIAGKVILFNDSCHAGNMLGGATKGLPPDNTAIVNELISAENGAVCFAAATGSEYAREDPIWGNGAFTKALVEGLGGQADYGHTGRITINMLALYIPERVKTLTGGTQHPTANKPPTVRDFPIALDDQK